MGEIPPVYISKYYTVDRSITKRDDSEGSES